MTKITQCLLCNCGSSARTGVLQLLNKVGAPEVWSSMMDLHEKVALKWTILGPVVLTNCKLVCLQEVIVSP